MPNINVDIPDTLHKQCKLAATAKGMTLRDYIAQELKRQL